MKKTYLLEEIHNLVLQIEKPCIIFLYGDLAAGKTTLSKHIIQNILGVQQDVISPTYTYYNKYREGVYHFDLYRLKNYDQFFAIGGEDILDNNAGICIIEWPEKLEPYYKPDIKIYLKKTNEETEREIEIQYFK